MLTPVVAVIVVFLLAFASGWFCCRARHADPRTITVRLGGETLAIAKLADVQKLLATDATFVVASWGTPPENVVVYITG